MSRIKNFASKMPSEPLFATPVSVKRSKLVPAGKFRVKQHRLRMPRVAFRGARRGMIAGDREDLGHLREENRQRGIEIFNRFFFTLQEIAVLAVCRSIACNG